MFGLEFAPHELINAVVGGALGAVFSLAGAYYLAKHQLQNTRVLARFLESSLNAEEVEIQYEDDRLVGLRFAPLEVHDSRHRHTSTEPAVLPRDEEGAADDEGE